MKSNMSVDSTFDFWPATVKDRFILKTVHYLSRVLDETKLDRQPASLAGVFPPRRSTKRWTNATLPQFGQRRGCWTLNEGWSLISFFRPSHWGRGCWTLKVEGWSLIFFFWSVALVWAISATLEKRWEVSPIVFLRVIPWEAPYSIRKHFCFWKNEIETRLTLSWPRIRRKQCQNMNVQELPGKGAPTFGKYFSKKCNLYDPSRRWLRVWHMAIALQY